MKNTVISAICLTILSWLCVSCNTKYSNIVTHKDLPHCDPSTYFTNSTLIFAESIQPDEVKCPKCKENGLYIQTFIASNDPTIYSQYICPNSHEWFLGQDVIGGKIIKIIFVK